VMKTRNRRNATIACTAALAVAAIWMLDVTSASASTRARGLTASHSQTHRAATRNQGLRNPAPGYGSTAPGPGNSNWRSWLEMEHYLDPCHCSDGI
jgi:hypothetical protein